jgi:hypothetical protein
MGDLVMTAGQSSTRLKADGTAPRLDQLITDHLNREPSPAQQPSSPLPHQIDRSKI